MLIFIIILVLLLPVTVLPLALETFFSHSELEEMGVCLEDEQSVQPCRVALPGQRPSNPALLALPAICG